MHKEIRTKINQTIDQYSCHQWIIILVGKHQRERGTYGSPLPPREGS
jgi:hypothetical protein